MPMNIKDYPANWREVSKYVRHDRADNRCETCGVRNRFWVARDKDGNNVEESKDHSDLGEAYMRGHHIVQIVLTTAHTCDCRPLCSNPDHLIAECQRCHLSRDAKQHAETRRRNRIKRSGQALLFEEV